MRGSFAVGEEQAFRPSRRELLIVRHILEIETEILNCERLAVRPAMALAQRQGEDAAAIVDLDILQEVGPQIELLIVTHEPRIGVDRHQSQIARLAHQAAQIPAIAAELAPPSLEIGDERRLGQTLAYGGQFTALDERGEHGRVLIALRQDLVAPRHDGHGARLHSAGLQLRSLGRQRLAAGKAGRQSERADRAKGCGARTVLMRRA